MATRTTSTEISSPRAPYEAYSRFCGLIELPVMTNLRVLPEDHDYDLSATIGAGKLARHLLLHWWYNLDRIFMLRGSLLGPTHRMGLIKFGFKNKPRRTFIACVFDVDRIDAFTRKPINPPLWKIGASLIIWAHHHFPELINAFRFEEIRLHQVTSKTSLQAVRENKDVARLPIVRLASTLMGKLGYVTHKWELQGEIIHGNVADYVPDIIGRLKWRG